MKYLYFNKQSLIISVLCFLLLYGCDKKSKYVSTELNISGNTSGQNQHIAFGVWLKKPAQWRRATTYTGFQARGGRASISVIKGNRSLNKVRDNYLSKKIENQNLSLLELRNVNINNVDSALLVVVRNNQKKTINYLMVIEKSSQILNVKSFCHEQYYKIDNQIIMNCLNSLEIGKELEIIPEFKIVNSFETNETIFTKDGKFPTQSTNKTTISLKQINIDKGFTPEFNLKNELKKLGHKSPSSISLSTLTNGKMAVTSVDFIKGEYFQYMLVIIGNNSSMLIKCSSIAKNDLNTASHFVQAHIISITVN